jgi:transposase
MDEQLTLFPIPECNKEPDAINSSTGKPRIKSPIRNQVEFVNLALDDLIPEDHQVRNIWLYINQMDLSLFFNKILSTSCNPGRPATDPKILLSLWIYAIVEGIGSARVIDRYCVEHLAFKWLCGGVAVNYHTISDFRKNNTEEFDDLIAQIISRLIHRDLVSLKRISQDGMRVRASAGTSSFRRKTTLKDALKIAKEQIETLKDELDEDAAACLKRKLIAKKRAAEERLLRLTEAVNEHTKSVISLANSKKKHRKKLTTEEKAEIRSSTTDPTARKMKMNHGGFSPAYNFQLAVDTESRFIVGNYVTNRGSDYGELSPMFNMIKDRHKKTPQQYLVDQGYLDHQDIIKVQKMGCKVYVNPKERSSKNEPQPGENEQLTEWRVRMGLDESKEIYKDRAANSEWANAGMRNRGLNRLLVRGLDCVSSVLNLHVLAHNMLRSLKLRYAF